MENQHFRFQTDERLSQFFGGIAFLPAGQQAGGEAI